MPWGPSATFAGVKRGACQPGGEDGADAADLVDPDLQDGDLDLLVLLHLLLLLEDLLSSGFRLAGDASLSLLLLLLWQNCITPPFGISLGRTSIILGCIPKHGKKFGMDPKSRPSQTPTNHPSQFFWHVPHSEPN